MQVRVFLNLCYEHSVNLINFIVNVKNFKISKDNNNNNIITFNNRYIESKHIQYIEFIHYNYNNSIQLNNNKIKGTTIKYKKLSIISVDKLIKELEKIENELKKEWQK